MAIPARIALRALPLLGLIGLPASAEASAQAGSWTPPQTLVSHLGTRVLQTTSAGGDETIAEWEGDTGVGVAIAGAGETFSAAQSLTSHPIFNDGAQSTVINAAGDAAVLFQLQSHASPSGGPLYLAYRRPGHDFSTPRRLTNSVIGASMAIDGSGALTIAWEHGTRSSAAIEVERLGSAAASGPIQTLASGHVALNGLAVNATGQAIVTWQLTENRPTLLAATRASSTSSFGTPVQVSAKDAGAVVSDTTIDRRGQALIVWDQPAPASTSFEPADIVAARLQSGSSAVTSSQTVAIPGSTNLSTYPDIALDTNSAGDAIVTWQDDGPHSSTQIVGASAEDGEAFGTPATITYSSCAGCTWSAGVGPNGQTVVSWDALSHPVRARVAPAPGAAFGPVRQLGGRRVSSADPHVAINARGTIAIVWSNLATQALDYARYVS